jgi:hypothetical protein
LRDAGQRVWAGCGQLMLMRYLHHETRKEKADLNQRLDWIEAMLTQALARLDEAD